MPSAPSSETARERELFRYYQPSSTAQDDSDTGTRQVAESSQDRALTALAQLGCLRMRTKRAMISFVDRKYEYIVAEATRTLSLQLDTVHDNEDHLLIGSRKIPRDEGICSVAVESFKAQCKDVQAAAMVIEDLSEDDRFNTRKFTVAESKLGFYASVVLRTPAGFILGAFSVIDDVPRSGISIVEEQFMNDIAETVMEHLEIVSAKRKQSRAENMVKGFGLFVEGKSSIRDWWLDSGHRQAGRHNNGTSRGGASLKQQADEEFGAIQTSSPKDCQSDVTDTALDMRLQNESTLGGHPANAGSPKQWTRPSPTSHASSTSTSHARSDWSEAVTQVSALTTIEPTEAGFVSNSGADQGLSPGWNNDDSATSAGMPQIVLLKDVKDIFSRASNLLREATTVEGIAFFDATIGNFGRSTNQKAPTAFQRETEIWTSSSEDEKRRSNPKDMDADDATRPKCQINQADGTSSTAATDGYNYCDVLGYSTRAQSSLHVPDSSIPYLKVPQKFLQKLLKRYPHGKIFTFDEDGSISSSEDDVSDVAQSGVSVGSGDGTQGTKGRRRETKKRQKILEAKTILKIIPGARNVAFMPIWDSQKERWFAGSLSWTTSSSRVIDVDEDMTYLAAFGHSIMAEVSRINALVSDQRKSDFIGSISHELRSPLHGVLASVEFLQDTKMSSYQDNMVSSIETCGKALLDIINQVLDFTKINSFNKARHASKKRSLPSRKAWSASPSANIFPADSRNPEINLRIATEEVIESIIAGQGYGHSSTTNSSYFVDSSNDNYHENNMLMISDAETRSESSVMFVLDIDWQSDWSYKIQAGVWRRIIMNLVSNAVKYTSKGSVYVSLRSEHSPRLSKTQKPQSTITLTVEDSGKGMSEDFLQNQVFQPFSQEDNLTSGTGLGLSIVRQIVEGIGGSITMQSEQGTGTDVTVSLTLDKPSAQDDPVSKREDLIRTVREKTRNLKICLVGFDVYPSLSDSPDGILSAQANCMLLLKSSITRLLTRWFNMNVVFSQTPDQAIADIYVAFGDVKSWYLASTGSVNTALPGSVGGKPLIILGSRPHAISKMVSNDAQCVIYVQQPCGPHAMAKALDFCIERLKTLEPSSGKDSHDGEMNLLSQTKIHAEIDVSKPSGNPTAQESVAGLTNNESPVKSENHLPSMNSKRSSRPRVLLVEDNEINLKLLVACMHKIQISYGTAINGLLALQAYQKLDPVYDVILLDISMPVMDGLTATQEIRRFEQERSLKSSKIVALTGAASAGSRMEALRCGVDVYLTKPVPMRDLRDLLGG